MKKTNCKINRQLRTILVTVFIFQIIMLLLINKAISSDKVISGRSPANFVPSEYVETISLEDEKLWIDVVMVEDSKHVLSSVRNNLSNWAKTEEYAILWNQESTGLYVVPTISQQKSYLQKSLLKYLDKRLAGEIKHAEKGSTMAKVAKVQKTLRPTTKVSIAPNIKIRFKARVLQGKAVILVENPYVECKTNVNIKGQADLRIGKNFKEIGVQTEMNYQINEGRWIASVRKKITKKISGQVSSTQDDDHMAFTGHSDQRVELFFSHAF